MRRPISNKKILTIVWSSRMSI